MVNAKSGQGDYARLTSVLAIAYNNIGVEEEHLRNMGEAVGWYRKAINFIEKFGNDAQK
jgi:hypothetical protein